MVARAYRFDFPFMLESERILAGYYRFQRWLVTFVDYKVVSRLGLLVLVKLVSRRLQYQGVLLYQTLTQVWITQSQQSLSISLLDHRI